MALHEERRRKMDCPADSLGNYSDSGDGIFGIATKNTEFHLCKLVECCL